MKNWSEADIELHGIARHKIYLALMAYLKVSNAKRDVSIHLVILDAATDALKALEDRINSKVSK